VNRRKTEKKYILQRLQHCHQGEFRHLNIST